MFDTWFARFKNSLIIRPHLFLTLVINTMTSSYKDLLKQREALEQQIDEARRRELSAAVAQVRGLIAEYGLSQSDVFSSRRSTSAHASKVAPKYRDPATGKTWTGRGKAPSWIRDENRDKFAI